MSTDLDLIRRQALAAGFTEEQFDSWFAGRCRAIRALFERRERESTVETGRQYCDRVEREGEERYREHLAAIDAHRRAGTLVQGHYSPQRVGYGHGAARALGTA